jgi:hypothetical protein
MCHVFFTSSLIDSDPTRADTNKTGAIRQVMAVFQVHIDLSQRQCIFNLPRPLAHVSRNISWPNFFC